MPKAARANARDITAKSHNNGGYKRNTGRRTLRGAAVKDRKSETIEAKPDDPMVNNHEAVEQDDEEEEESGSGFSAHSALLTLLKQNDTQPKKAARKKQRQEASNNGEIEGLDENQETELIESDDDEELESAGDAIEITQDDDNEGDIKDPFEVHFANSDPMEVSKLASKPTASKKYPQKQLGEKTLFRYRDDSGSSPITNTHVQKVKSVDSLKLKYRLNAPFIRENSENLTELQKELAAPLFSYQDVLYQSRTYEQEEEIQNIYSLHILNHIFKTRDRVVKNNSKISSSANGDDVEYRDQGFTRPKVLILLPTRNAAWKFITRMTSISGLSQTENRKRFKDAFYDDVVPPETKPEDFKKFFAGNTDDMFCLGVKFTRQATKLYSSFYNSDLIVASPLGLKLIIGHDNDKKKKQDYDFLSSIELLLIDQADGMYMQTWDNVEHIMKHMNLIPKESHGCDFSRVRNWYLEENAQYLRQTIMISEFSTPEMNNCFTKYCHNVAGFLKCRPYYDKGGAMGRVGRSIRQTFTRIEPAEPRNDPNVRFKHFTSVTLPSLLRSNSEKGTLIFVPSYMDFVRLRNYMDNENLSCSSISEYTETGLVNRARTFFANGRTKMLMMTERFHHFRRFQIKGVNQVIMYGVPENPQFYKEAVRFLLRTHQEEDVSLDLLRARIIFSKWDNLKLERIVGSDRLGLLFEGVGETYDFNINSA